MSPAVATHLPLIALAGNPNVGKSSLFNRLTGLRQKVGNYAGVTVERTEGEWRRGATTSTVVDLPGTYSLVARAPDERVAADVLSGAMPGMARPDAVIVVIEASQLRRGLFLLSQVCDLDVPVVVALNMVDEARRAKNPVDGAALSRALGGVPVVETVAPKGIGVEQLGTAVDDVLQMPWSPEPWCADADIPAGAGTRWQRLRSVDDEAALEREVAGRYAWVNQVVGALNLHAPATERKASDRIDRVLLHPALGFALFCLIMATIFQAVFSWSEPGMKEIQRGIDALRDGLGGIIPAGIFRDLLLDGAIKGVGSVLVFLPQILILFFFLGILEDTGYMTRAAFIVDRPLRAIGLSGRAFIPLLSSFACAVPGIMAARVIEDRRERLLTILIAPLMTCSARLQVFTVLVSAFVPDRPCIGPFGLQAVVMLALYVGGTMSGSLAALVLARTVLRGKRHAPIMELPRYRRPHVRAILTRLRHRTTAFVTRAGTFILTASLILWALAYFPRYDAPPGMSAAEAKTAQLHHSAAGTVGRIIEPVIRPLGLDWKIGIGLVSSFAAREVFVSTMSIVYAVEERADGAPGDATGVKDGAEPGTGSLEHAFSTAIDERTGRRLFDPPAIVALLIIYVIAPQCVSTLAVVRRETGGWRWPAFLTVYLSVYAYVMAWLGYVITAKIVG